MAGETRRDVGPEPIVHVRLRDTERRSGTVLVSGEGGWSSACTLPCALDVPRRTRLRVAIGDEHVDVVVDGVPGVPEDVVVVPDDRARRNTGTGLMIAGGGLLGAALGTLIIVALTYSTVGRVASAFDGGSDDGATTPLVIAGVLAGAGAPLLVTGVIVRTLPRSGVRVAPSLGRVPVAITPMTLGFTF